MVANKDQSLDLLSERDRSTGVARSGMDSGVEAAQSLFAPTAEREGLMPPANGAPSASRAANLMTASAAMPDVVARAQMSIALQRNIGNARMNAMFHSIAEPKAPPPAPPTIIPPAPEPNKPAPSPVAAQPVSPTRPAPAPAPAPVGPAPAAQTPTPSPALLPPVNIAPVLPSGKSQETAAPAEKVATEKVATEKVATGKAAPGAVAIGQPSAPDSEESAGAAAGAPPAKKDSTARVAGPGAKGEAGKAKSASPDAEGEADAKKGGGKGAGAVKLKMPEPPSDVTPATRQRIRKVQTAAGSAATSHATLPPAGEEVAQARAAVTEPTEETHAHAEENLVVALGQRPKPSPKIEKLCENIYRVIKSKRPPDEDSLVDADPEEMGKAAGGLMKGDVQGDVKSVDQSYDALDKPPSGTPQQVGKPLESPPADVSTAPINATQATPDKVPAKNVSLDADAEATKARMAEAGMEKEPAKLAQTGPVAEAREAQGELEQTAKEDPAKVLASQQASLAKANSDMAGLQQKALNALSTSRHATVTGTTDQQKKMVGSEAQMRTDASKLARDIFTSAQTRVNDLLRPLPQTAMEKWDKGIAIASHMFKEHLKQVADWIKERHSGVGGTLLSIGDYFTGLPAWVTRHYDQAEQKFGDDVCNLAREISTEVNGVIMACEAIIADARTQIAGIFSRLPDSLQGWAATEQAKLGAQLDSLEKHAHQVRDNFDRDLVKRASQSVQEVREQIGELRQKAKGLIGRVVDAIGRFLDDPVKFIIEALLDLLSIPRAAFWAVVAKIKKVIGEIADDPMKFANNLMDAVGKGFSQFFDNILDHLLHGFVEWLTGGLASAGVELPKDFSLKSVITFFLQLMGITWPRIRKLLAKHIGEENVALLEKAYSIVANLIAMGPEGIFEMIKEKLNPQEILDQIIKAGVDYLIKAVVKAVSARIILLFNPVGAILQALEAIYRVLKWIFTNAARIFRLIETIVNGIADILAGNIGAMANAVEKALAGLIAPVIDFLADYLGFGDLPDKIRDTIMGFQAWIEGILDQVIGWLVEKGKALLAAVGLGGESDEDKQGESPSAKVGERVPFTADGEGHNLWIDVEGNDAIVMVGSNGPLSVGKRLAMWSKKTDDLPKSAQAGEESPQAKAKRLIGEAEPLASVTDKTAEDLVRASQKSAGDEKTSPPNAGEQAELSKEEHALADKLRQLFEVFGEEWEPLGERFKKEFQKMHELASEYSLGKLEEADPALRKSQTWQPVRAWLLAKGLIFTEPMTRTTKFVKEVTQPKAESAADSAIKDAANKYGFSVKDVPPAARNNIVDNSRSEVNAGSSPFDLAKGILQEFGFSEQISPVLTLKNAYLNSSALANELGFGEIQLHHLITNQMVAALAITQGQIPGQQLRDNTKYQYNSSPGGHIGYERWHRQYDSYMVGFITRFPSGTLTVDRLILEIHNYYQTDHGENVTKRIPGVNIL